MFAGCVVDGAGLVVDRCGLVDGATLLVEALAGPVAGAAVLAATVDVAEPATGLELDRVPELDDVQAASAISTAVAAMAADAARMIGPYP